MDIKNFGVSHDEILAVTCLDCAKRVKGTLMPKAKIRNIDGPEITDEDIAKLRKKHYAKTV